MKKIFLLLLFLIFLTTGCSNRDKNKDLLSKVYSDHKIVVGVKYDSKPFGFVEEDELRGFDIDIAKGIAKRLLGDENALEFKKVTPSNRIMMLSSGKVDMVIATMTITPKRLNVVDFSSPYHNVGQAVMVKKDSKIYSTKDLNQKKVMIILGSTSEQNIRLLAPEAKIRGYKTYTEAYEALNTDKADALSSDDSILYGFLYDNDNLRILPERYTKESYAIAFRKDEKSKTFQYKVEDILNEMKKSGEINSIRKKWIK